MPGLHCIPAFRATLAQTIICALLLIILLPGTVSGEEEGFEEGRVAYIAKDYDRALQILTPLAEQGNPNAQVIVGIMYDYGHGVPKDSAVAMQWYEKAADQGVATVQHDLGVKYFRGTGVPKDYKKAAYWWRKAADQGLAESQYNLGLMYARGLGVEKNSVEAARWYRLAAAQDHPQAQYSLAVIYTFGDGVEIDYVTAATLFRKSAEQGVPQAQYNLGVLLENGRGTPKNLDEARKWYQLAADQGLEKAQQKLATLDKPASSPSGSSAPAESAVPPATAAITAQKSVESDPPRPSGSGEIYRKDWINGQNPDNFTVQLSAGSSEKGIVKFIRKNDLGEDNAYFAIEVDGKMRYTALHGSFSDKSDARKAISALPAALKKSKPWIRQFADIQQLIKQ